MKERILDWFARRGWTAFDYQQETWKAYESGASGLVHAPTGTGKSYAVWLGPVLEWMRENPDYPDGAPEHPAPSCRVLWLTPLRALATDTVAGMERPLRDLGLPWSVEKRTGDTSSSVRRRQRERLPTALVTTPESLSLLLTYPDAREKFADLRCVIVDEWHEILGNKRGVQTQLCLARLRRWFPEVRLWGLSATLGNTEQALEVLLGTSDHDSPEARIIRGVEPKETEIRTLLPDSSVRFPWAGHLGLKMLPRVMAAVESTKTTLLFCNTRSQTEQWYKALLEARPGWAGLIAVHHGSIDRELRGWVEGRLAAGELKCVVCTSSLDLGVDFTPVEQVIQVGSPKGVARLLQRAGRSGHQPGVTSRVLCVPTHAFELVEFAAARKALEAGRIESRLPPEKSLDVLVQHLTTLALGGGFAADEVYAEVRRAWTYRDLSRSEWQWALDFLTRGGPVLQNYPEYRRLTMENGNYVAANKQIARLHRLAVGTISSDNTVQVRFLKGGRLGTIEESFIARLKPGDRFLFAGRLLEFVRLRDMTAWVRKAAGTRGEVPRWMGGRMPLSSELANAVREELEEAEAGALDSPEMEAAAPLFRLQQKWSRIPRRDELLIECIQLRGGHYTFLFPFAGRMAHEGLAALAAYRVAREQRVTLSAMLTDYGISLCSAKPLELGEAAWRRVLSPDNLLEDLLECLNASELARRQFRDIARIAGLVFPGYPGQGKTARQLQASSGLLFDVFQKHDPENRLLDQARREVLEQQLEFRRLSDTLERIAGMALVLVEPPRLTPFAFPIWAEVVRTRVSSESWRDRVERMAAQLEAAAERWDGAKRRRRAAG